MKFNKLIPILILLTACQKPAPIQPAPETPIQEAGADTLRVTGYYNPQSCTAFFDARISPSGTLLHDNTTDPAACNDNTLPFHLQTFRFPMIDRPDYLGLRISLDRRLLLSAYRFTTNGFQLSTPAHPDFQEKAAHRYAFATPGKQVLQIFFLEPDWGEFRSSADKLEIAFQLERVAGPAGEAPAFQLLQGRYAMQDRTLYLDNLPDWKTATPEFQFQLIDSLQVLRIRSCYTLLTEDFAIWNEDDYCQDLQNWDLSLIPARGYNLLEAKIDPPFLECLREGKDQVLYFRIALLAPP